MTYPTGSDTDQARGGYKEVELISIATSLQSLLGAIKPALLTVSQVCPWSIKVGCRRRVRPDGLQTYTLPSTRKWEQITTSTRY